MIATGATSASLQTRERSRGTRDAAVGHDWEEPRSQSGTGPGAPDRVANAIAGREPNEMMKAVVRAAPPSPNTLRRALTIVASWLASDCRLEEMILNRGRII
jgi:hypothetical protein